MLRPSLKGIIIWAGVAAAGTAGAQLLPQGIGALPGQVTGAVLSPLGAGVPAAGGVVNRLEVPGIIDLPEPASLLDLRRQRLRSLIRENRSVLDADRSGNPIRRDEVILIDPKPDLLVEVERAGFKRLRSERIEGLDLSVTVLAPPKGKSASEAVRLLETIDPEARIELNHVFEPAGGALGAGQGATQSSSARGALIGMIDGGVGAHPAFASAAIEQRGFAPGGAKPSGHGTAVASLLVGSDGAFTGAARGANLLVADIYGGQAAAGSAELIARALGWLAERKVRVVTVSLVGPPNRLLERAVKAVQANGIVVVAAVGNDGPAAPVQYPAAYSGVIAVTAVDARDRALVEAGKAAHLDFAAPGADMAAAVPGRGYVAVRGTSFAAPLVAARIATVGSVPAVAGEALPGKGKVGRGILCKPCRVDPKSVRKK